MPNTFGIVEELEVNCLLHEEISQTKRKEETPMKKKSGGTFVSNQRPLTPPACGEDTEGKEPPFKSKKKPTALDLATCRPINCPASKEKPPSGISPGCSHMITPELKILKKKSTRGCQGSSFGNPYFVK